MKSSKLTATFLSKFSTYLSKFKQSSTITIAHEQIRKLFTQYKYHDIILVLLNKMDSFQLLNQKQKKQYAKIYITLFDVYGKDTILEYYDRIIESLAKKSLGVADVIAHLCRTLIKKISPPTNIGRYITHFLTIFIKHIELAKILKQIIINFPPQIIQPFQTEIMGIINQKMNHNPKTQSRIQYLQSILSLVLILESNFTEHPITENLLSINFRNAQWTVRKLCVDISYALFVIDQKINELLHLNVIQLKYDKIKHVRDAVQNYTTLHKQLYGDDKSQRDDKYKNHSNISVSKSMEQQPSSSDHDNNNKFATQSNQPEPKKQQKSIDKSMKNYTRNQSFFLNAANNDIIKLPQCKNLSPNPKHKTQNSEKFKSEHFNLNNSKQMYYNQRERSYSGKKNQEVRHDINSRKNMRTRQNNYKSSNLSPNHYEISQNLQNLNHNHNHNLHIHKQKLPSVAQAKQLEDYPTEQPQLTSKQQEQPLQHQTNIIKQLQYFITKFNKFSVQVLHRLTNLQRRVITLQNNKHRCDQYRCDQEEDISFSSVQKQIKQLKRDSPAPSIQQSFQRKFNQILQKHPNNNSSPTSPQPIIQSQKYTSFEIPTQSNLDIKIQQSLQHQNWNQTYSLVIANNSKSQLIQLLKYYQMPTDKLVQDCLFAQVKKNLDNIIVLKWLTVFIKTCNPSIEKMRKLYNQLNKPNLKYKDIGKNEQLEEYQQMKNYLLDETKKRMDRDENQYQNNDNNYSFKNKMF